MNSTLPRAARRRAFRHVAQVLLPHWPALLGVVLLGLLTAVAGIVGPWVVGRLVDILLVSPDFDAVVRGALVIVAAGIVGAAGTWAGTVLLARAVEPAVAALREDVLHAGLDLDSQTVETSGRGDLVSRIADDSREITTAATEVLPLVIGSLFTVVVSAVGMTSVDWRLGLIGLVAVPLYWTTLRAYLPRSGPLYRRQREVFGIRTQRLLGGVEGADTLRAYGAEHVELRRIDTASATARDLVIRVFRFVTWAFSRNNRAEAIVLVLLLAAGFLLVRADAVTVGAVSTAALIFHRLFGPIGALVGMFDRVQSAGASLVRMVGVIDAAATHATGNVDDATSHDPASTPRPLHAGPGPARGLHLSGISHRYDAQRTVVAGVDLTIGPGEHVAVVGATGAGKSTVALIAAGLLSPSDGTVSVGGVAVPDLPAGALREAVCMVSQEVHDFRGDVLDNVRIARPDATDAEARAALHTVGATEWVAALPDGEDTRIGDGGHRLTGIQSQILALARVALADPAVVILDEATAEAGSGGADQLDRAATAVIRDRAALLVAHRLGQAAAADRIVVMDGGRVVETGSHAELVAAGGRYAQLWAAWSAEIPGPSGKGSG